MIAGEQAGSEPGQSDAIAGADAAAQRQLVEHQLDQRRRPHDRPAPGQDTGEIAQHQDRKGSKNEGINNLNSPGLAVDHRVGAGADRAIAWGVAQVVNDLIAELKEHEKEQHRGDGQGAHVLWHLPASGPGQDQWVAKEGDDKAQGRGGVFPEIEIFNASLARQEGPIVREPQPVVARAQRQDPGLIEGYANKREGEHRQAAPFDGASVHLDKTSATNGVGFVFSQVDHPVEDIHQEPIEPHEARQHPEIAVGQQPAKGEDAHHGDGHDMQPADASKKLERPEHFQSHLVL